ncbi:MAG: septum formation inhibitor Maf [Hungatella sp.]|nr:septum formation inhibitor Maf [Hungatella sp.]
MKDIRVILASGSPRRKQLLEQIGVRPEIRPSRIEEQAVSRLPEEVVMELSCQKAEDVAAEITGDALVLGADTVVAVDGDILGKPKSHEDAMDMVRRIQGRSHQVYTGVTLIYKKQGKSRGITFAEKTEVFVYPMTEEEMKRYADSAEPMDKAGAYGIQGAFAAYIEGIHGDYTNVVGLPVGRVCQEWKQLKEEMEDQDSD